jgi:hypothetical protein
MPTQLVQTEISACYPPSDFYTESFLTPKDS